MSRLVWTNTGDTIELNPIDGDVYNYFVEQLNQRSINHYTMPDLGYDFLSKELVTKFDQVQKLFRNKLKSSAFDFEFDSGNQEHLNTLHRHWVKVHQEFPNIGKLFDTQIPGVLDRINKLVHAIEESTYKFEIESLDSTMIIPNPFGTDILKHGIFNVSISFNNLGRSSYHKWVNNDTIHDTDTNNFFEFHTTLMLKTLPPVKQSNPPEYQTWCDQHGLPCVGSQMPLANFDKLDNNMLQYRQLFYKNSLIENNFITLE
jgi:hypothetical protein